MTARFAAEAEAQSLLEKGYTRYPTELGNLYIAPGAVLEKDTITLGFQRMFLSTLITLSGVEKISRTRPSL